MRPQDYPLAPEVLQAYGAARALVMELDLDRLDVAQVQGEMLAAALLPQGTSLPAVLGAQRYARASKAAHDLGVELSTFDRYAPWFAAEAISQLQLTKLGFESSSGVEMYLLGLARHDGKPVSGLETVHDQITLFGGLSLNDQADYLLTSLEEAHALPQEVGDMVRAWQRGDTRWFERELQEEFGHDPALYASFLTARNRRWLPKIEALLQRDENYLVIVGTGHLVGTDSVVELLGRDGISAVQE